MVQVLPLSTRARDVLDDAVDVCERAVGNGRALTATETAQLLEQLRSASTMIAELDDAVMLSVRALRTGDTWYTRKMVDEFEGLHDRELGDEVAS